MRYNDKEVCDESKTDNEGTTHFKCEEGFALEYKTKKDPTKGADAWLTYPGADEVEVELKLYNQINNPGCAGGSIPITCHRYFYSFEGEYCD
ncbi:uncharacterized protein BDW47DRAFT_59813 [Aspergillus candidus]|uniref:Uncharacterized protein n=1 Tax=Aspergillus candidus TaxID=41067 RepID=A0A2I2F4R9_ASPCN|nr:hypothetical protein BDW47DRAFT_59813 [Aspergillus candidus]PLB35640.1 hypothetical protein BDW47DRAFT_59813 [Aspergillus candidus]